MLAYLFVVIAALFRILPVAGIAPFHFTPVGASLLFFGAHRPKREMWFPVALFFLSDLVLNYRVYHMAYSAQQLVIVAWYAVAVLIGGALVRTVNTARVAGGSLTASISFYIVSNFTVWATWHSMYPKTLEGLVACYVAAIPFFRNMVVGDLLFSAILFSVPAIIGAFARQKKAAAV